ncbi:ABC transporter permease [Candidatus Uhrbacteria bacterium]|nr:ABC transporter permease [Candidatus Uhrbacteria bacterium]
MLISTGRALRFAIQNFHRNIWLAIATTFVITLSLLSINFFILANAFVDTALKSIEDKINITVYFKPTGQEQDFLTLSDRLRALPAVASVDYISKDEALLKLKERYAATSGALLEESLKELDKNPLTPSLVIRAKTLADYPAIQGMLSRPENDSIIEKREFADRQILIEKITALKKNIQSASIFVNLFFAIIAALIVYNTIRITIYTRRREVGIMKLVGATNWFIRAPLLIESVLYSITGSVLALLILYPMLGALQPYAEHFFDGAAFDVLGYFSRNFWTIFGLQFLAFAVLNILSSVFAIGRYLKV